MMESKVALVPFPFDDLRATRVRPAVCLTDPRAPQRNKFIPPQSRSETMKTVTLRLPDYLAETLPAEESSLCEILKLGLKQFRIERAIKRYKKGGASLAKAAEMACISIREMVSIAYAHGLEPKYDESLVKSKITPEVAVNL